MNLRKRTGVNCNENKESTMDAYIWKYFMRYNTAKELEDYKIYLQKNREKPNLYI